MSCRSLDQKQPTPRGLETTKYVGGQFEQIAVQGGGMMYRHHISNARVNLELDHTNDWLG